MALQDRAASNLAAALLSGSWSVTGMARRAALAWGRRERWFRPLARKLFQHYGPEKPRLSVASLALFVRDFPGFEQAWSDCCQRGEFPLRRVYWFPDTMVPGSLNLPVLNNPRELADWLGLEPAELDWFADCQGRTRQAPDGPLRHYTYRWLVGRKHKVRLLEIPKARLKALQRRLLAELLGNIPTHEAAHGYRPGRSIATHVAPHAGRRVVLHLDLRQFFPSVRASRVHALFRAVGYPRPVARLLTGLCTNAVPAGVLDARPNPAGPGVGGEGRWLLFPHLPQGAPTSPALANLCAYRLDCRLEGLACEVGGHYTRYADDLVFSGDEPLERCLRRFHVHVCRIVLEEGFEINTRKSHFMRQGVRQQVAGIVLNARPNLPREEFDRLKATLTNCVRQGPASQNREGHADFRAYLAGRIAYFAMINPARGRRLRDLFGRIRWEESDGGEADS